MVIIISHTKQNLNPIWKTSLSLDLSTCFLGSSEANSPTVISSKLRKERPKEVECFPLGCTWRTWDEKGVNAWSQSSHWVTLLWQPSTSVTSQYPTSQTSLLLLSRRPSFLPELSIPKVSNCCLCSELASWSFYQIQYWCSLQKMTKRGVWFHLRVIDPHSYVLRDARI